MLRGEGTGRREGVPKPRITRETIYVFLTAQTELSRSSCRFVRNWVLAHSVS
ncbi:hypothetical protein Esi_0039_0129 [Ectocarpus siliculosus]|uniref:Uncharacterized protein n=1 Tax=Ectocarpus siliculosus TaxID=2880 RepID=D7G012_ECTSI|nr:hypothetical protein Esi_0039_0129 [Ectocarpus siliculosus]|eukprot:CBJ48637.1 hypothetical protein Esi_0039_0129 [Ectocarpus siliculosus]